ncbi:translation initiation factor 3 subunit J, partial [Paragonimus westermani]
DSWDAEEPKPAKPQPVAPATEKVPLAERIKLKEEKRRKEKEEKLKRQEEERAAQALTELQRQRLAEEAELGLLQDTFGKVPLFVSSFLLQGQVPEQQNVKDGIFFSTQRTKEDFNQLNDILREKVTSIEKSPHYSAFAERLIRDLIVEIDVDTLRTLNTAISALLTEKQKLVKGKVKKKAKGKLLVERENDYNVEEDAVEPDEFDDFM